MLQARFRGEKFCYSLNQAPPDRLCKSYLIGLRTSRFQTSSTAFSGAVLHHQSHRCQHFQVGHPSSQKNAQCFQQRPSETSSLQYGRNHTPPPVSRTMNDEDPVCEVEAIHEYQGTSAKTLPYKVKLKGYPEPDWEPLANLTGGC